jgi:K+-transporting ATPase KdpF subunit
MDLYSAGGTPMNTLHAIAGVVALALAGYLLAALLKPEWFE